MNDNNTEPMMAERTANVIVTEQVGDLFDAPPNSVLIHACNTVGSWGAGIARGFKQRYPDAFRVYNSHCKRSHPHHLVGTALLIAPRDDAEKQHYVGCVFTSEQFGRNKDSPDMILKATESAMRDLLTHIAQEKGIGEIRMCRINAGLFAVPWEDTKKVIEGLQLDEKELPKGKPVEIVVCSPA
ncbi:ADP-ribose 1''-phosphate phosphatase [Echria macrotheca]|uniref:ADP-ribose 1''-phosphate phosphatase n=1 Tax=Echria macrotheca TaxID=438768 RepID=A0AAJ0BQ29_9PEZI|nr:ADP-ribose 1''-phosphate phosphatase [Echria macrotheca]